MTSADCPPVITHVTLRKKLVTYIAIYTTDTFGYRYQPSSRQERSSFWTAPRFSPAGARVVRPMGKQCQRTGPGRQRSCLTWAHGQAGPSRGGSTYRGTSRRR